MVLSKQAYFLCGMLNRKAVLIPKALFSFFLFFVFGYLGDFSPPTPTQILKDTNFV